MWKCQPPSTYFWPDRFLRFRASFNIDNPIQDDTLFSRSTCFPIYSLCLYRLSSCLSHMKVLHILFNGFEVYLHQVPLTFTYFQKPHPIFPSPHELHSSVIRYIYSAVFNAELRNRLSLLAHKSVYWNMWLCNKYSSNN